MLLLVVNSPIWRSAAADLAPLLRRAKCPSLDLELLLDADYTLLSLLYRQIVFS